MIAQAIFASYDLPTASFGDSDARRALLWIILTGPLFPVLSASFGVLVRSTVATVTIALALLFVPSFFHGMFPEWWQKNILSLLPGNASDSLTFGHLQESAIHLSSGPALVVVLVWLAIFISGGYLLLNRRDA